ncbi:hypothetical protein TcWFU_002674 [Taenia crassiceps]
MKYVHQWCLQHWIEVGGSKECELCQFRYSMRRQARWGRGTRMQKWKFFASEVVALLLTEWSIRSRAAFLTAALAALLCSLFLAGLVGLLVIGFVAAAAFLSLVWSLPKGGLRGCVGLPCLEFGVRGAGQLPVMSLRKAMPFSSSSVCTSTNFTVSCPLSRQGVLSEDYETSS